MLVGLLVITVGCRGPESYLPQPRLPDDEDEVVTAPVSIPNQTAALPNQTAALPNQPGANESGNGPRPPATNGANPPIANVAPQAVSPVTAAVTTPVLRPISSLPGSITPIRPGNQLSVVERRRHSIACMQAISDALERYRTKHRRYPDCYYHSDDQPYLSWRVELLPYLGYAELYKKFDYREPWDGAGNRRLVAEIPPVYQSPERGDERTNYLLAVGQHTAYVTSSGPRDDAFPDGLDKTILLIETDDAHAVPWTKPDDWRVETSKPREGVFSLREDGFFAVMGKGGIRQIPHSITDPQLAALWTARGDEAVSIVELSGSPSEIVDEKLAAAFRATRATATAPAATSAAKSSPDQPTKLEGTATSPVEASSAIATIHRPALPAESDVKRAEGLIKQVYADRYAKAKNIQERREVAMTMLSDAESVRHELPSYYTMLRIARDVATSTGDIPNARSAMQRIENTFEMDVVEYRLPWLETAATHVASATDAALLIEEALGLFEIALEKDAFDAGRDLHALFLSLARKSGDEKQIQAATGLRDRLQAGRKAYAKIADNLHTLLRSPDDPQANQEVGKYLCFVKRQWEQGVSHLARGSDGPLKQAASLELQRPTTPDAQAILGDTYWSLSETHYFAANQVALRDRAAYWYRLALPQHSDGLRKALIQERLRMAEDTTTDRNRKPKS